jgi:trehalose-6-phosphate synthase
MFRQRDRNHRAVWTGERPAHLVEHPLQWTARRRAREPGARQANLAADNHIVARRSASGLVTAMVSLVRACSGVWVAHGAGTADRVVVDRRNGVDVPPASPQYRSSGYGSNRTNSRATTTDLRMKRAGHCHRAHVQPVFRSRDFNSYRAVNARFCRRRVRRGEWRVAAGARAGLSRRPGAAADSRTPPRSTIVAWWHIPWPHPRDFEICPWAPQLLKGCSAAASSDFRRRRTAEIHRHRQVFF